MSGCGREGYPSEDDAEQAAEDERARRGWSAPRLTYRCSWDKAWHIGKDPGPITPCHHCRTLVVPRRGTLPLNALTGRSHTNPECRRAGGRPNGGPERDPINVVSTGPGTCGVCGAPHKRVRTADTGMTYCPPCYGLAKDGRLVAA